MEEIGVVKAVLGRMAKVSVQKKGVCEHCTAGTCHISEDEAEIDAMNDAGAHVGDKVRVVLRPISYLKGSMMIYGLPALALIVGAVVGKEFFSRYFKGTDPELVSAAFAFGLFAASFLAIKIWSGRVEKKTEYKPVIEEILNE